MDELEFRIKKLITNIRGAAKMIQNVAATEIIIIKNKSGQKYKGIFEKSINIIYFNIMIILL